jgi:hypothetical protein
MGLGRAVFWRACDGARQDNLYRRLDPKEKQATQKRTEAQRKANTFGVVAEDFINKYAKKLRSMKDVVGVIRRELMTRWFDRPIAEITRKDVRALIMEIADCGQRARARKTYAVASKLFAWAVEREMCGLEASPCTAINISNIAGPNKPRQRVLSDGELRALWRAVEGLGYPAAPFCPHAAFERPAVARSGWNGLERR